MLVIPEGLKTDSGKVSAVEQWPVPQQLHDVQAFIGFSNFYQKLIASCSQIVYPLTACTKPDIPFMWQTACERGFGRLKKFFVAVPILRHFDPERKIMVKSDTSNLVIAGVLPQYNDDDILHPVAYSSRKCSPVEINLRFMRIELS
jgi:hypothetical protein